MSLLVALTSKVMRFFSKKSLFMRHSSKLKFAQAHANTTWQKVQKQPQHPQVKFTFKRKNMHHTCLFTLLASKVHEVESQVKSTDRISKNVHWIKTLYARVPHFSITVMKTTLFTFTCCSCLNSLLQYISTCVRFILCNYSVFMFQLFVFWTLCA